MSKGTLKFLHQVSNKSIENGKKVIHEEEVAHGDRGISFKYYHKEGDKIEKIRGIPKDDGTFIIITGEKENKKDETMSKEDVIKMLTKMKHLKFALDYIKTAKGGKRGSRKGSKKGSKKGSRKGSRKMSGGKRRGSRKGSKGSKKGSKKGSRKMSGGKRRGSRKGSKGSRKGSKKH